MRFAASPGFMNAYGLIDSFDPNQLRQQAADGRTLQNRAVMAADAAVRGAELKGEAEVEAAKYLGAAREAQGAAQGMSAAVGGAMQGLRGLGSALKPAPLPYNQTNPINQMSGFNQHRAAYEFGGDMGRHFAALIP